MILMIVGCFIQRNVWAQPSGDFSKEAKAHVSSNDKAHVSSNDKAHVSSNDKAHDSTDALFDEIENVEKIYPSFKNYRKSLYANTSRKYTKAGDTWFKRLAFKGSFLGVEFTYDHELSKEEENAFARTLEEEGGSMLRVMTVKNKDGKDVSKIFVMTPQELTSFMIAREKVEHGATDFQVRTSARATARGYFDTDKVIRIDLRFDKELDQVAKRELGADEDGYTKIYMNAKEYRAFFPNQKDFMLARLWRMITFRKYRTMRKIKKRMHKGLKGGSGWDAMFPKWNYSGRFGAVPPFEIVGDYRPLAPKRTKERLLRIPKKLANLFWHSTSGRGARARARGMHSMDQSDHKRHIPWLKRGVSPSRRRSDGNHSVKKASARHR